MSEPSTFRAGEEAFHQNRAKLAEASATRDSPLRGPSKDARRTSADGLAWEASASSSRWRAAAGLDQSPDHQAQHRPPRVDRHVWTRHETLHDPWLRAYPVTLLENR